jgi:hypothetical protein
VVVQGGGRSAAIERKNMGEKIITKYVGYNKRRVAEQKQVGGGGGGVCVCACGDTRMGMRRETFKGQVTRFAASVLILESLPYCRHNSQVLSNPTTGPCTVNVCNSWYRLPHTNYGTHVSW